MRPEDLSEFSYGYAVTEELVHRSKRFMVDAPYFPSLRKEGQAGGGYDLRLDRRGVPLFIQFKLSDCLKRRNKSELKLVEKTPFYRMYIRNQSKQHELLLELEQKGNKVFYVAPAFFQASELRDRYIEQRVLKTSMFLKPGQVGKLRPNRKYHVSFHDPKGQFYVFSQPTKILNEVALTVSDSTSQGGLVVSKRRSQAEPPFDKELSGKSLTANDFEEDVTQAITQVKSSALSAERFDQMFQDMLALVVDSTNIDKEEVMSRLEKSDSFQRVAYMARNFFGCETLVAKERQ